MVTIRDVARAAGVSASTVSRALATPDLVNATNREKVLRAAERLGYRPNRAARGLTTGRTGNLGLIVPDLANPFFPGVVKGVQARAREADFAVFVADTDEDVGAEAGLARNLVKQVDGLVLCSTRMSEQEVLALASDVTLVLLHRRVGDVPAVTVDNADGMRQAVAHLAALGHRRIGYVGGPAQAWSHLERLRGLRDAAGAEGVELIEFGSFAPYFESGIAAADLALAARVTAVVGYNDLVALGLLNRFSARGVAVPHQVSVVGCDDVSLATMGSPPLTSVALPKEQAGRAVVSMLIRLFREGQEPPDGATVHMELPTQLIVRGSTGPAPGS